MAVAGTCKDCGNKVREKLAGLSWTRGFLCSAEEVKDKLKYREKEGDGERAEIQ